MKILITGGAGFIGSHLAEYLVGLGHKITVLDNFSAGSISNLTLISNEIDLIETELEDFDLEQFNDFNAVVHLAAQASVPISISQFYGSSKTNLLGALNVIDFCSSKEIPLIYASSSAVYGELDFGDDIASQVSLLTAYATDKYAMELYCNAMRKTKGLTSVGLRFYNVYGPRQNPTSPYSGVISKFLSNVNRSRDLLINGGHQTRDFVYVTDVVLSISKAILNAFENKGTYDVVNVLTGRSVSIDYLADTIIKLSGRTVKKSYKPLPVGDPVESRGSVTKLDLMLDGKLNEFVTLENGLINTAKYINNLANQQT